MKEAFVYFIRFGADGPVKIGVSGDPARRLRSFETGAPGEFILLAAVPGNAAAEHALHRHFADDRLKNEWFAPSERLLALVSEAVTSGKLPAQFADAKPVHPKLDTPHARVLDLIGVRVISNRLNIPFTTVYSWRQRGYMPARQMLAVMELGNSLGHTITADDFFDRPRQAA